jgi:hypothetical protein
MKQSKRLMAAAVTGLLVCAALPQLIIYYRGYYYVSSASAALKYSLNAGCFIGVAMLGNWYLRQYPPAFLPLLWRLVYLAGGLFIAGEYIYHFIYPNWGTQTYLFTMGTFEVLVSPLPFIIAWFLLRMALTFDKSRGKGGLTDISSENPS